MSPSFSIVMPAFNAARTVVDAARSALGQTRRDLELIIIDDGSADQTPELISELASRDARVRVLRQANAGASAARNAGIEVAGGRYVGFLDSDDLWMPDYVEVMSRTLDDAPDAGFAYCDAWALDDLNGRIRKVTWQQHYAAPLPEANREQILAALVDTNFVMNSTTCRAEALAAVGGFDSSLRGAEDWELWIRIVAAGWSAVGVPACLMIGRDRADSLSKDEAMMWSHVLEVAERVAGDRSLPEAARQVAQRKEVEFRHSLDRVSAGGLRRIARRGAAAGRRLRTRHLHRTGWFDEPPEVIAAAFPELARRYGKPNLGGGLARTRRG